MIYIFIATLVLLALIVGLVIYMGKFQVTPGKDQALVMTGIGIKNPPLVTRKSCTVWPHLRKCQILDLKVYTSSVKSIRFKIGENEFVNVLYQIKFQPMKTKKRRVLAAQFQSGKKHGEIVDYIDTQAFVNVCAALARCRQIGRVQDLAACFLDESLAEIGYAAEFKIFCRGKVFKITN